MGSPITFLPRTDPTDWIARSRSTSALRYSFAISSARIAARSLPPQAAMRVSTSASNEEDIRKYQDNDCSQRHSEQRNLKCLVRRQLVMGSQRAWTTPKTARKL